MKLGLMRDLINKTNSKYEYFDFPLHALKKHTLTDLMCYILVQMHKKSNFDPFFYTFFKHAK